MNTRDIALAVVAGIAAIVLGVVAFAAPKGTSPVVIGQIITGLVAIGTIALGRISGANSAATPAEAVDPRLGDIVGGRELVGYTTEPIDI